ncbi:MAG: hypothetical protein KME13_11370 [Myxacorys californica WJT36-NPBG1]|nr:hypothetical protein [Myxacorys californica WJT36-NPBG1]
MQTLQCSLRSKKRIPAVTGMRQTNLLNYPNVNPQPAFKQLCDRAEASSQKYCFRA